MKKQFLFLSLLSCFAFGRSSDQAQDGLNQFFSLLQSPAGAAATVVGATLLSRPLVGYLMQLLTQDEIEKYNLWELISVNTGRDHNDLQTTGLTVGGLRLKFTMLDVDTIKQCGIIGASLAVIRATDPAISKAFVQRLRELARLKYSKDAARKIEAQKDQWSLNLQANILNFGIQTRIALSEIVLTTTGLLALAALQGMLESGTVPASIADATTTAV